MPEAAATEPQHYDTVVIGCGMSGLGAAIRLAMYDRKVLVLERHNAPGGLNSFYFHDGRKCDVGLHALTNYTESGRGTALNKIFRQLRIDRASFELCPQFGSRIAFRDASLRFGNGISLLQDEVARVFPAEADRFRSLVKRIEAYDARDTSRTTELMAREALPELLHDPLLIEMLLCPILYYGSSRENDVDFDQFCILFRALFLEGFSRPYEGVRQIIRVLLDRYRELGGQRRMRCGVRRIHTRGDSVSELELDTGERITADHVISSIGAPETWSLMDQVPEQLEVQKRLPRLAFAETMTFLDCQPKQAFGWEDTIVFFNDSNRFSYERPEVPVDLRSGVICIPNNYDYGNRELPEGLLRVTAIADYETWKHADEATYLALKQEWYAKLTAKALDFLPRQDPAVLAQHTTCTDMFTPRTVEKFTGHVGGAVYGSPEKLRDGRTHLQNLYVCGTDQGFLGIVGSILSGISMANAHVLAK